jgi:hypothetical protein
VTPKSDLEEFVAHLKGRNTTGNVVMMQLRNQDSKPQNLYLEPMGDHLVMPPGATYVIVGKEDSGTSMSIDIGHDGIVVWQEGHGAVFQNGVAFETTYYLICRKLMQEGE